MEQIEMNFRINDPIARLMHRIMRKVVVLAEQRRREIQQMQASIPVSKFDKSCEDNKNFTMRPFHPKRRNKRFL
jgi:hypothetical protein